eukprot:scaffold44688_cov58-Attheya_sp.AAC.1
MMLSVANGGDGSNSNKWDACSFSRHGGDKFISWWSQRRTSGLVQRSCLPTDISQNWNVVGYVRLDLVDTDKLKADYFCHLGGQLTCFCGVHGFPLVNARYKTERLCSCQVDCGRKSSLECPDRSCIVTVCRYHQQEFLDKKCGHGGEKINIFACDGAPFFVQRGQDKSQDIEDEVSLAYSDMSGDSYVSDGSAVDLIVDCPVDLRTGTDCDNDDSDSERSECELLPTTAAGDDIPDVGSDNVDIICGQVYMNGNAQLLKRQGKQLLGSRGSRSFLLSMASTDKSKSIQLLYGDAAVFTSVYWSMNSDGSIDGAMPVPVMNQRSWTRRYGFAGVVEQIQARSWNASLLCGTDPRQFFNAFDQLNNLYLRMNDSRVVMRRGFERITYGKTLGANFDNDELLVCGDVIDSRQTVQQLSLMLRQKKATYFLSFSCNQKETFGVSSIKQWVEDECETIMNDKDSHLNFEEREEIAHAFRVSSMVQMFRTWCLVVETVMDWIVNSDEHPCGVVEDYFWRHDNNEVNDNLTHVHCILFVRDAEKAEYFEEVMNRIRCSSTTLMTCVEVEEMARDGILDNRAQAFERWEASHYLLRHDCIKGGFLCRQRIGPDGVPVCCVPDFFELNPYPNRYMYVPVPIHHTDEALAVFQKCGLLKLDKNGDEIVCHPGLKGGRYVYPSKRGERFTPVHPKVYGLMGSQSNMQRCSDAMSSRYLAYYNAMNDESVRVSFDTNQSGSVSMHREYLGNMKIKQNKNRQEQSDMKHARKKNTSGEGDKPQGILLHETTEALFGLFNVKKVHMSARFVKVPTLPLEERPGHIVASRKRANSDFGGSEATDDSRGGAVDVVRVRNDCRFPRWRQFTDWQVTILLDRLSVASVSMDQLSIFSIRPPELLPLKDPGLYLSSMVRLLYAQPQKERNLNGTVIK